MAVNQTRDITPTLPYGVTERKMEAGFTLIESVVAMGLFVGVVFLLVSVLGEFMMDDFTVKSNKALVVAENEISNVERTRAFESTTRDTIGFHIIRTVTTKNNVSFVDVAVTNAKKPTLQYVRLSKVLRVY
ncbi:MAG: type II secretion system protein [Candidatus Kryptoniota bacterium]